MAVVAVVSFGLIIYRLPLLRARHELDSWVSREAAFLANNWMLLFAAIFVLFATMFPTISEALTGERLTVGPPFFNKWMLPIGLVLLFLTGVGPLLAWRKSTLANLRDQFLWPALAAVATPAALALAGVPFWPAGLNFALCAFVGVTIVQEFVRGAGVRKRRDRDRRLHGDGRPRRPVQAPLRRLHRPSRHRADVRRLRRRGVQDRRAGAPEAGAAGDGRAYTLRNDGVQITDDGQKQMVTGHLTVLRDGKVIDKAYPAKWFYRKHEQEPVSQMAIRRSPAEDLYIVMPGFDPRNSRSAFRS